jgi:hypothetical protein
VKRYLQQFSKSFTWQNIDLFLFGIKTCLAIVLIAGGSIIWIGGGILLLPITTPTFILLRYVNKRLKFQAANRFSCTNCGNILGNSAIELAEIEWNKLIVEHPLIQKRQSSARNDAICSHCGSKFTYVKLSKIFNVNPDDLND